VRATAFAFLGLMSACLLAASNSTGKFDIGEFSLGEDSLRQWKLPKNLKEISGLAMTPDDRLFAVDDEQAVIYEIDYQQGKIIKSFGLGSPITRADFEGIAYLDSKFYLVTSHGLVYVAAEGDDGERVDFDVYQTGLGRFCEIEGLASDARSGSLLLACKKSRGKTKDGKFSVFVWSPATGRVLHDREIAIPEDEIAKRIGKKNIRPSAIAVDPESGNLFGVAGPQRAIFELTPSGELIDAIILPLADRHRQPEGIEITSTGKLIIADEGGKKKARLGVYSPDQNKAPDQQE
jgi:uncharacterized protein YjiK